MTKTSRAVLMLLAACAVFAATTEAAHAKTAVKKEARSKKKAASKKEEFGSSASKLGTDFSFSDADVRGKYQSAGEGVVTVENEKELTDLLGARRHFKDRLAVEAGRK